jgi:glyoxylase-like metal-dependent hydrolase (beta-lactamase superfamily II)
MKKVLLGVAALVVVLLVAMFALVGVNFVGLKPAVDGTALAGGAKLVKDGYVNVFVLPTGEKTVGLIDCGNDLSGKAILAELSARGLGPDAVTAIFVTHGHPDHTAGCHLFPKAALFVMPGDKELVEGTAAGKGFLPGMMGPAKDHAAKVTRVLNDGETVEAGTLKVQAFSIPGHTGGSAAYLASGVLYLGDSLAGQSDGEVRVAPGIFSDDQAQCRSSVQALARRLKAENVAVTGLAFAHSGPFDSADALWRF